MSMPMPMSNPMPMSMHLAAQRERCIHLEADAQFRAALNGPRERSHLDYA